jgi:hypothetical protein
MAQESLRADLGEEAPRAQEAQETQEHLSASLHLLL